MISKVCVVGAGAIGGCIGTRLAAAGGVEVSALARGATLRSLRQQGWRLHEGGRLVQCPATASDDPRALGAQDLVIIAVKAQALPSLAPQLAPLIGPRTLVLPAMNGVPWWFSQAVPALGGAPLASVDRGGGIARAIPFAQVLGCVVHMSCSSPEPGLVQQRMGRSLIIGEPSGARPAGGDAAPRAQPVAEVLRCGGFEVTLSPHVQRDIWYKLWGNLTMNPLSAITGATIDRMLGDDLVRGFCTAAMREAALVGEKIGCPVEQSPDERHAVTARLGAFKTSMLQDVEAGRAIELDAIVSAVHEIARRVDVATPFIDGLLGLTRLFARVRGLYPEEVRAAQ